MTTKALEERPDQITIRNLMKLPSYFISGVKYHAAGHIYVPKPLYATLHVTHRCNSRCVMCSDWKNQGEGKELTTVEIERIFSNPLFHSVEKFALSGGEPTLRENLIETVETVLDCCPQIKETALLTNGLEPNIVEEKVKGLLALSKFRGPIKLMVQVSLDGYGDIHEKVRRVPRAFERATETIKVLKRLQLETPFYLCVTCVVQSLNLSNLVRLSEFGKELGIPINFVPVDLRIASVGCSVEYATPESSLKLTDDQLKALKVLFENQLKSDLKPSNRSFWREYFHIVNGEKRRMPCFLRYHYVGVDCDGTLYMCTRDGSYSYGSALETPPDKLWYSEKAEEMRKRVGKYSCRTCTSGCDTAFSLRLEFFYYAGFLLREKAEQLVGK